jgi:CheY-like chemotaxis protein
MTTPLHQKLTKAVVEAAGLSFVGVESGASCLRALHSLSPDLILLDIMMPGMDGFETCRRIRAHFGGGGPRVVFLTARNLIEDLRRAIDLAGDDYLVKPVEADVLRTRMLHWIKQGPRKAAA